MRAHVQKIVFPVVGVALLVVSVAGLAQSARAGLAQTLYRTTKFGLVRHAAPEPTLRRAQQAHRLYPYNYYFCIWTAEKAYYERAGFDGREQPARVEAARLWCDRGLALNPFNSQVQRLKTRLLARTSPRDALDFWKAYVDWYFWEPYHHAVLVDLYTRVGALADARDALRWVKDSPHYADASAAVRAIEEPEDLDAIVDSMMDLLR